MISDESELTDLDELSEEYGAKQTKTRKGKGKARANAGYRLHNALKAPRATTYSTESLYKQIVQGTINLEPDYQREVVWTEAKQTKLIDSIFRNFYIPPVIFAVNTDEDGTETRTCIDGKQRLTSIYRFLDGLIPHKDAMSNQKLWYKDNPNTPSRTAKRMLPKQYCNLFDTKAVVCVEYEGLRDQDEREIFQRVQLGVALTPAEKLKVLKTPRAVFVRKLQDTFLDDDSPLGGEVLAWDRSRGSDFRCLAQTIQCIAVNPKTTSIQATEKWLADTSALDPGFAEDIENTYQVFAKLAASAEWAGTFRKPGKVAPVEFISMGMLVHRHKRKLTMAGLAAAVSAMRRHVRDHHDDIRNNGKVYKTVVSFIDGYNKGGGLSKGETSASAEAFADPQVAKGMKRKRRADDSDEDSDDEGDGGGGGADDEDYAPARKRATTTANPSVTKHRPVHAPPLPTPPVSAPEPPTETTSGIRALKARMLVEGTSGGQVQSSEFLPTSVSTGGGSSGTPRLASSSAHLRGTGQQQQYGGLEAGLMGGGAYPWSGGSGGYQQQQPNGSGGRVKQESPGTGAYAYGGSGSNSGYYGGGGGGVKGENGNASGRYSNGSGRGYDYDNSNNSHGRERERDRGYDRGYRDRDYGSGSGGGSGSRGGRGGRGGGPTRWS